MNILNTDIVNSTEDIYWDEIPRISQNQPKPVLILSAEYLPGSNEDDQLRAIMNAGCKLTADQYNVVLMTPNEKIAWRQLRQAVQPRVVLLFNVTPANLGISALFRLNELNNFDGCFWIPTFSLERISQDKELKGYLWNNSLKPLFVNKTHGEIVGR